MIFQDSSDEDREQHEDAEPLKIDWVQFSVDDHVYSVAVGELPGKKYRDTARNLKKDLDNLQNIGISHIFCLCNDPELQKFGVSSLLQEYVNHGFVAHHYPIVNGAAPDIGQLLKMLEEIKTIVECGNKVFIHCFSGFGSSCVVITCLSMYCDKNLTPSQAINTITIAKGTRAIQTVKQYNFINEFRELQTEHINSKLIRRLSR